MVVYPWSTETSLHGLCWQHCDQVQGVWRLPVHVCRALSSQPSVFFFVSLSLSIESPSFSLTLLSLTLLVYDLLPSWPPLLPPEADADEVRCWLLLLLTSLEPQWEPHMCVLVLEACGNWQSQDFPAHMSRELSSSFLLSY